LGKTFLLALWGIYPLRRDGGARESGHRRQPSRAHASSCPGPDHDTVFETLYSEMLVHAARAELRGHLMPGERSEKSVNWRVRPMWNVEAFSPPSRVHLNVAHTASGRHHRNQIALIEEGQGVSEPLWRAAEGMCSSAGNQIASSFNPTEPVGPAYERARNGTYRVIHLDAFEHPNIVSESSSSRRGRFQASSTRACASAAIAGRIPARRSSRSSATSCTRCRNATPEHGARTDNVRGHPDAKPRVYRPTITFTRRCAVSGRDVELRPVRFRGNRSGDGALGQGPRPDDAPDRVGLDPAREGDDDAVAAPAWGETAEQLLRAYFLAEESGPAAIEALRQDSARARRRAHGVPKSDGVTLAQRVHRQFPDSPFTIDEGASARRRSITSRACSTATSCRSRSPRSPNPPVNQSEPWSENMRTQLYLRASMAVNRGLVDVPDDPILGRSCSRTRSRRARRSSSGSTSGRIASRRCACRRSRSSPRISSRS
jgi:hypothetical protein